MSLRVGVLSTFCGNYNYGGKLQAYALVKALEQAGAVAYQIQYQQSSKIYVKTNSENKLKKLLVSSDYRAAARQKLLGKCVGTLRQQVGVRKAAFERFDKAIPHTERIYADADIAETVETFDMYICGSDQIWNPDLFKEAYFLGFVPQEKYKISYAASISKRLEPQWEDYFRKKLADFDGISVRERAAGETLAPLVNQPVRISVDPTLLLEQSRWDKIAGERIIQEPYLFCYFLGYGRNPRRIAKKVAKRRELKIVTLPHLLAASGRYFGCDLGFGDEKLYDVSPGDFLSLIKHADYVLTDSFHATVFSILYHRQFLVFSRTGFAKMGDRLADLLEMFELESRFCSHKLGEGAIKRLLETRIQYAEEYPKFQEKKDASLAYLMEHLQKAERRIYEN